MNANRIFTGFTIAVVVLGVVLAFFVVGTPQHARELALDERRATDLASTAADVRSKYQHEGLPLALPSRIQEHDPQTKAPYPYRRLSTWTYELCAIFSTKSEDKQSTFAHGPGRACYRLDVRKDVDQATPVAG